MSGQLAMIRLCAMCIVGFSMCFGPLSGDAAETDEKCTDFYSYACNDMKKSGVLRRNEWTDREKNAARMDSLKASEESPFKSYYLSCLNPEGSKKFLDSKMRQIIKRTYKEKKKLTEEDLAKLLDETSTLDNEFFEFGYERQDKNKFVIAGRTWTRSEIDKKTNPDLYEKYEQFVKQLFEELDSLYDESEWTEVLRLEQEIIEAVQKHKTDNSYYFNHGKLFYPNNIPAKSYKMNQLHEELKKSEWASKFNLSNFLEFFNNRILSGVVYSKVVFMGLAYFQDLQAILGGYQPEIIARYILLKGTLALYYTLPQSFKQMPSDELAWTLHLHTSRVNDKDSCWSEILQNDNIKRLEDQFYMDKCFSGQTKIMADDLYGSIKTNFEKQIMADPCMPNNVKASSILTKIKNMKIHLGRFDLPFFQYKKTSFYNGSYFENVLASQRDFIQTIADGENGIGIKNLTSFQRSRKLSYYEDASNTLYIFSYVFNTTTKSKSEFYGAAGPHIVESLFNAFKKEKFEKCSDEKQKKKKVPIVRKNPEEYFLETELSLTLKAYQSQDSESGTENENGIQQFFLTFTQEFCGADDEEKSRFNKVLSSNAPFKEAFKCA